MLLKKCSLFLLIITLISYVNCNFFDAIISSDANVDKSYLQSMSDILDPRNIIGGINTAAGTIVQEVTKRLGSSNEIIELANSRAPQMIQYYNYPVEVHEIMTEDGYILETHRIPYGRFGVQVPKRGAVILYHGMLCSSACWILLGPGRALPFILADLGYDVWMGNIRGNTYSRKHKTLIPGVDSKFWEYSFHEVGKYDLPATIDYVRYHTGEAQVFFIAHSTSTTSFFVMCSERPEYNDYIRAHFSLAPAAHMKNHRNPILYFLAQFSNTWHALVSIIGYNEFLPNQHFMSKLSGALCTIDPLSDLICANSMFALGGFNRKQLNNSIIPIIFGHTPAGTSLKTLIHYGQIVRNFRDRFQYFSYGFANPLVYHALFPPEYKLKSCTAPTYCFYSRGDWLVSDKDAVQTCNKISNLQDKFVISDDEWTHNDYVYANDAKEEVYDKIVDLMQRF